MRRLEPVTSIGPLQTRKAVSIIDVTVTEPGRTGTMALETSRLHPLFGVETMGLDVRRVYDATFHDADIAWGRAQLAAL
jgi:hypothetical protein